MKFRSEYEAPWVDLKAGLLVVPVGDWRYQRPVTKRGKCCLCGICFFFCPTGCVDYTGVSFTVNLDYCKGCGICAQMCPKDAIMMVREEVE